jgi:hypothetical protein
MRPVHDIARAVLRIQGQVKHVLVAFIQHGHSDSGYRYEGVCPMCAATLGYFEEAIDAMGMPEEIHLTELLNSLMQQRMQHFEACPRKGAFRLSVFRTDKPLQTEQKDVTL